MPKLLILALSFLFIAASVSAEDHRPGDETAAAMATLDEFMRAFNDKEMFDLDSILIESVRRREIKMCHELKFQSCDTFLLSNRLTTRSLPSTTSH